MSSEARSYNVRANTQKLDRAPPHRPLMNSHAHVILELPAPKEVSNFWDLNDRESERDSRFLKI